MKAILTDENKRLRWTDVPDPVIKTDEVLIKIHAAALNRADLMQRDGNYPPPEGCPEWMGLEISGEILEMGDEAAKKSPRQIGERVCALLGGGGYAQFAAVRHDMCLPVPEGCNMTEAAAIPEAFATSYLNLFIEGGAKAGDTVFITAGGSGLASVMIPMAKAFGMKAITTVRSGKKAEAIAHLKADIIVNTAEQPVEDVLKHQPVDVAIDCVGGKTMGRCLQFMERGGRWIVIAALDGELSEINLRTVYAKGIRIIGSTLRSRDNALKAEIMSKIHSEVYPFIESGRVRPTIYKVLPITQAEEAQAILYRNENVGKVVMTVI